MPDDEELLKDLEETPDHAHTLDPIARLRADSADRRLTPYDLSLKELEDAYNEVMRYAGHLANISRSKTAEFIAAKAIETYDNADPNQGPPIQQGYEHQSTVGSGPSQQRPIRQLPVQQLSPDQQVEPPIPLPDLPEDIWVALERKPYDPFWMETYGVSEKFLSNWNSKKKVEELFQQGALRLGDYLHFEVTSATNMQETRYVVVRRPLYRSPPTFP
ncbi:MAG: hypothetical protein Q9201_007940 [Fulgogasparrea decipioides]